MDSPMDWVAARSPPVPDELKAWLKISDDGSDLDGVMASVPESLLRAGLLHLEAALGRPGRGPGGGLSASRRRCACYVRL